MASSRRRLDKTLNPDGTHIMSLFTQWVPAEWARRRTPRSSTPTPTASSTPTTRWRPASRHPSPHRDVVGPHQMEQEYGLIGGNIFHGELSLEQLFHMRPAPGFADYRTPIAGPVQRQFGHARRRRRVRHPGLAGGPGRRWPTRREGVLKRFRRSMTLRRDDACDGDRADPPSPRCSVRGRWRWSAPAPARTASARG